MSVQVNISFHGAKRRLGRKPTIWQALADRLGREPTHQEAKDEVRRILSEAASERASA